MIEYFVGMETEFTANEKLLSDLSSQIEELNKQMSRYLTDIVDVSNYHRNCKA